jgi:hypothetical protein
MDALLRPPVRMKYRFLIWGLAYGLRGMRLAGMWLDAIQTIGKWRHDIILLGDEWVDAFSTSRLKTINIIPELLKQCPHPRSQWTKWTLNNFKSQLCSHIDIAVYDYILYLDMDVLVNSDRLEGLVYDKWKKGIVAVQKDRAPLTDGRLRALHKMGVPDENERAEWARRPICAGMMGFPVNQAGLAVLRDYHDACIEASFEWSDQAKLTALLNRKHNGSWEFLGDTTHGDRFAPPYEETLVHFTANRDVLLERYYLSHPKINDTVWQIGRARF